MSRGDVLVVGAGFAGSVCARELADAGHRVVVIDRRDHIGGNAWDCADAAGLRIHPYGPHIFHTNAQRIVQWLSRFTDWHPYQHRVLARVGEGYYPIPINRTTINRLYGLDLDPAGIAAYLERVRLPRGEPRSEPRSSEDVVLGAVGRDLCDTFFRGYTRKQWGMDLSELAPGVAARIPVRHDDDDRYFTDAFQAMPRDGYAEMFRRMLDDPRIELQLGCDFASWSGSNPQPRHTVYTGSMDAFFGHVHGRLPYRSLRFEHQHLPDTPWFQPVGTVNYPGDEPFTRITEFKHMTGQQHTGTSIVREYPSADGEPYYPVPTPASEAMYARYRELAEARDDVTFVGRLAEYRYYNMDQVVGAALSKVRGVLVRLD